MLIYMDHIKKLQCQCLPNRITKEEAPGDLGGGRGEWSQGIYAPNSLPVKSPWLSDLNDSLLLLPEAESHSLLFFWVHGQRRPGFPYHPSLFPQYSTYIFITELFTSKPPSVYSNSRVPSVSYRISTWHTLVHREHSMIPQKKWSKISPTVESCLYAEHPYDVLQHFVQSCQNMALLSPEMYELNIFSTHSSL